MTNLLRQQYEETLRENERLRVASREREQQAYERAAKVVDDACNHRIGEHARGIEVRLQLAALASAIRALAAPDSASLAEEGRKP